MSKLNGLDWAAMILSIIGGINWGLIGALNFNLVGGILGSGSVITRLIYVLVGLAGVYLISMLVKMSK